jgi:hypothetical protein
MTFTELSMGIHLDFSGKGFEHVRGFTVATLNLCNIEGKYSQRVDLEYNLNLGH